MKILLITMAVSFLFLGCASAQPAGDEPLANWKGKSRKDLIAELGQPTSEITVPNGIIRLTWEQPQRHPSGIGRLGHAESYSTVCVREFEIDSKGLVSAVSQRGCW
jgi:hypothetical protein